MMNQRELACLLEGERLIARLRAMLAEAIDEQHVLLDMIAGSHDAALIASVAEHMRGWRERLDAAVDDLPSTKVH